MNRKEMGREQLIQALYDAKTEASIEKAGDDWLAFYKTASQEDKEYLGDAMRKFSEYVLEKSRQSHDEFKKIMTEYESMKPEMGQN